MAGRTVPRLAELVALLPLAAGLGTIVFLSVVWISQSWGSGDASVYLAAGERLNAGHDLYALQPGDRPIQMQPPYWTVPLLSPPLIAVLWRPLAAVPALVGLWLWSWTATFAALGTVAFVVWRRPIEAGRMLLLIGVPVSVLAWSGNVDAFRLPATLAVFWLAMTGRSVAAGVLVGALTAIKLTPVVLVLWLMAGGQRRGVAAAIVTILGATVISLLGAGLEPHVRYLEIVRNTVDVGTAQVSLAGLARGLGISPETARWLPTIAAGLFTVSIVASRGRPAVAFRFAVLAQVFGAPAAGMHTFGLLLAMLAPSVARSVTTQISPWSIKRARPCR
jgi:alpha-1,2-mannosyltransferase